MGRVAEGVDGNAPGGDFGVIKRLNEGGSGLLEASESPIETYVRRFVNGLRNPSSYRSCSSNSDGVRLGNDVGCQNRLQRVKQSK